MKRSFISRRTPWSIAADIVINRKDLEMVISELFDFPDELERRKKAIRIWHGEFIAGLLDPKKFINL